MVAPSGNILVLSEFPFGVPAAVTTIREYDPGNGKLVRVFMPDGFGFRKPRGLRFGPDGHLYCVARAHEIVAFDFGDGSFLLALSRFGPPERAGDGVFSSTRNTTENPAIRRSGILTTSTGMTDYAP